MLEIKRCKECPDGHINRLDTTEERISYLHDVSIESSKTEKPRQQRLKQTKQNYLRTVGKPQNM